jgi:hypothetical protein
VLDVTQPDRVASAIEDVLRLSKSLFGTSTGAAQLLSDVVVGLARSGPMPTSLSPANWLQAQKIATEALDGLERTPANDPHNVQRALRKLHRLFSDAAAERARTLRSSRRRWLPIGIIVILAVCGIVIAVQVARRDLNASWLWAEAIVLGWIALAAHDLRRENDPGVMREVAAKLAGPEPLLLSCQIHDGGAGIDSVVVATDQRVTYAQPIRGQAAPEILWSTPYDAIRSMTSKGDWETSTRSVTLSTDSGNFLVALPGKAEEAALAAIWTQHRERSDRAHA